MTEANSNPVQKKLFDLIQDLISDKISLVFELSELLGISQDSVYRRLRCETLLGIDEIQTLCSHYGISFDMLCQLQQTGVVSFNFQPIQCISDYTDYLIAVWNKLNWMASRKTHIYYLAIDIPIFHNFRFPLVSYFKSYYWLKSISDIEEFRNVRFSVHSMNNEIISLGQEIAALYASIPSTEIWTDLIINSIIKQIDYYWESGDFESKDDVLALLDQVSLEFEYLHDAARNSVKNPGDTNLTDNFTAYYCDIEIANNCILVDCDNQSFVYLSTHTYNRLMTYNAQFCEETRQWANRIISKSLLISGTGEKQRAIFFNNVRSEIERMRQKVIGKN